MEREGEKEKEGEKNVEEIEAGKQMEREREGIEGRRFKRVEGDEEWKKGFSEGGKVNSVKYPQLDATHWHTVSMQILFTLGSPPPVLLFLLLSLTLIYIPMYISIRLYISAYIHVHLVLSLSPSRFAYIESLFALSSFALLFHP